MGMTVGMTARFRFQIPSLGTSISAHSPGTRLPAGHLICPRAFMGKEARWETKAL